MSFQRTVVIYPIRRIRVSRRIFQRTQFGREKPLSPSHLVFPLTQQEAADASSAGQVMMILETLSAIDDNGTQLPALSEKRRPSRRRRDKGPPWPPSYVVNHAEEILRTDEQSPQEEL
ncbi:uncharacterized protein J3R85_016977 [Psidium guajava]|nr:uncharacterized protein J3R85_016977 [Psidium guajava]